jgi:hypothetical protein
MKVMPTANCYYLGLDLGQAAEFTALAVLERPMVMPEDAPASHRPPYALRHLQRFPIGTHYSEVLETLRNLLQTPPLRGAFVAVDQTGVGAAVVSYFKDGLQNRVTCSFCANTITTGHEATVSPSGFLIPKKELVGTMQVLLQTRRLHVARSLSNASLLVQELENFRAKVSLAQSATFETWREGNHDDLVLAVALAAWWGEKALPGLYAQPPSYAPIVLVP